MINLSQETQILAERLAVAQGLPVEQVIRRALEISLQTTPGLGKLRDVSPAAIAVRKNAMNKIVGEIAALPILDPRSPHDIADDLDSL